MNYEKMDDQKFARYLRKHPDNQPAWQMFLGRYHRLIWHYLSHTDEDAEDLYQEIQLAIWDGIIRRYSGEGTVLSYVGGIIVNKIRTKHRMQLRESLNEEFDEMARDVPDSQSSPAQKAIEREAANNVAELLQRFKPKEQKMLILQYFGYAHKEIMRLLGIRSVGASRKFLSKLLDKVTQHCQQLGVDALQFKEGMQTLCEEGKLHEMLSC